MKNLVKLAGFIAILAVIGVFFGCDEPTGSEGLQGSISIDGVAQVGEELIANTNKLGGYGEIDYKWKRDGNTVVGNGKIYTVRTADVGSTITVTVSRYTDNHYTSSLTSSPTAIVTDFTLGLNFTLINNGTAYSVSKGNATASFVIIPTVYEGLPVTAITDSGFTSYTNLISVIMPVGITRIGDYAFFQCNKLTNVVIPAGVTNIGNFAFQDTAMTTVYYGGSSSSNWAGIVIGSSNTSLLNAERYYYSVTHPGTANTHWRFGGFFPEIWTLFAFTLINNGTEYSIAAGTSKDNEVIIPATYEGKPVTEIESYGFSGYENLNKITIPNSVTSIGYSAFNNCSGLTSINVDLNNPNYTSQNRILYNKTLTELVVFPEGIIGSFIIPNSVTSIGYSAFSGCVSLTSITIPNSVTSIGAWAFSVCVSLTSITIPNSVTSIGYSAFYSCKGLTSVTIGTITSTNFSEFYSFPGNLRDVYFAAGGGAGTYVTANPGDNPVWVKQ